MKARIIASILLGLAGVCSLHSAEPARVNVSAVGEFQAPGRYTLSADKATVGELVRAAGGFTNYARLYTDIGGIIIYGAPKPDSSQQFGARKYAVKFYSIEKDKTKIPKIIELLPLEDGDILFVDAMVF